MNICKKLFGKKEPVVEFYSLIPELETLSPIRYMKDIPSPLVQAAARQYSQEIKHPNYGTYKQLHTVKCPGIQQVVKKGFVITAWQDITIETDGNGGIIWETPIDQTALPHGALIGQAVDFHPPSQYTDLVEPHPNTFPHVVKFNMPWRVKIPKGYCLLEGPIPYTNERRFTTLTGILDHRFGVVPLNVQVLWHLLKGRTVIKAGTPLARYVLVPDDEPGLVVRKPLDKEYSLENLAVTQNLRSFVRDVAGSRCIFSKIMSDYE